MHWVNGSAAFAESLRRARAAFAEQLRRANEALSEMADAVLEGMVSQREAWTGFRHPES